jgi:hypothetical protein
MNSWFYDQEIITRAPGKGAPSSDVKKYSGRQYY